MAKILIVDDQACIRELLSDELTSDGYRVATAGNAESISGHLKFSRPDLVILDCIWMGPTELGCSIILSGSIPTCRSLSLPPMTAIWMILDYLRPMGT